MSALRDLLESFRKSAKTNREVGTYFEELIVQYLRNEPAYRDLYREVKPYGAYAKDQGFDGRDVGIDLVAVTHGGELHAIQCKLYPPDYKLQKVDIDSFFTASGKAPFSHRIIVATTSHWSEHAEDALLGQQVPVTKIDLFALENSVIDWSKFKPKAVQPTTKDRKKLRPHQLAALKSVLKGLEMGDRGKLLMACGTGKTFTSLKIAEEQAGEGKRVLFLVPSLALLSQTLTEWTQESEIPLHNFAVCSDSDVGKKRKKDDDTVQTFMHELQYPATTDAKRLAEEMKRRHDKQHMSVVYATYHSIDVLSRAQKKYDLPAFDLIVCDEAHRTTGATFEGEDESHFVKVHNDDFLKGRKRLYMTATPRIYGNAAKATAERDSIELCSMDDLELFGPELHVISFSQAVKQGLLVDYKVVVLSVSAAHVSRRIQELLRDENNQLRVDDAAKIVGCWKALSKKDFKESLADDEHPMKRAVAFCQVIEPQLGAKTHKVSSKSIAGMFQEVVEAYQMTAPEQPESTLTCEAAHVDGSMNATEKEEKINWLKEDGGPDTCRILSNVRCLSEGVDVPALDAVLFLTPRNSQIDVVQSVGRVMRNASGKVRGYIVLPVVIPEGMKPHEALNDNKVYGVVWQVLQALRSHDDRFDAMVNKLELTGADPSKMEVIAITDRVAKRSKEPKGPQAKGGRVIGSIGMKAPEPQQDELEFEIGEVERAIYAKLVEKVGNRRHWEEWAKDIAKIANTHIDRIKGILENKKYAVERAAFEKFAHELRDDLNDSITDDEIVEMLAQHMVTKPVFDALFAGNSFASQNPMSKAMQGVLEVLQPHRLEKEAAELEEFYASVKLRAEGIDSAEGRQKIVVELYDKFFRNAFPKMSERLGIVYTPVEIVDFILKSVDHLLRTAFGQTLGSSGVHILDPFTGTGTFITRLIQTGLIAKDELPKKFKQEIHANEIVLLAYYIAAINIEAAYHGVVGGEYTPFEGICLTDTFQLYEKEDLVSDLLVDNSARRNRQKTLDIRVIVGNPPYSIGQDSENDNNKNITYPQLDKRIAETYVDKSNAKLAKGLYDSYVRAIRWASDRVGKAGVVGFVTNANFIDANTYDGLRRCLTAEFSDLYIFHLRGNQRTAGELSKKEGGKVFGSGSRAPVAISLLLKDPKAGARGRIHFRDIGDYLSREQKLEIVHNYGDVHGVSAENGWRLITPDEHADWLNQRDATFQRFRPLGDKEGQEQPIFSLFSLGVVTNRDAWAYSFSKRSAGEQVRSLIDFYNSELKRFDRAHGRKEKKERESVLPDFINTDATKIAWTRSLKNEFAKGAALEFVPKSVTLSLYRPFTKQWLYFHRKLNEMVYQQPRLFPVGGAGNRVIGVSASESRSGYSVLMADVVPSLHATDMVGSQYFPLFIYDEETGKRTDAISGEAVEHFRSFYPGEKISKEDIFYYVYGVLHSPDYRERYADNLGKELPRIPRVAKAADFWAFSKAGRELGELHVGFEQVPEYSKALVELPSKASFRVEKMRFGKGAAAKEKDKTVIQYNDSITVRGIPLEAYEYVVNGKSAIEWVMERQAITTDADSAIVKDANDYAKETMKDSRYPLSLLLRVITVSLETMKLVKALPRIDDPALARENQAFEQNKTQVHAQYRQQAIDLPLAAEPGAVLTKV
ncbi:DEAD/DEAH box helicase [Corallococcus coralloides]|nr:DEAD/DEAH box helicase [Corallococcus coralloides]